MVIFEDITAMTVNSTVFWDVMPCSLEKFFSVSEDHIACILKVKERAKQACK
jgi:hypothetical protein